LISDLFVQSVGAERFLQWTPDRYQTWRAVTISNKYFRYGRSGGTGELAKINPLVDPEGIIASLGATGFHHTTDNQVGYFERVKMGEHSFKSAFKSASILDANHVPRYIDTNPGRFAVGDIVEARLSFVGVPVAGTGGKKYKLSLVLRSLALIDDNFTKVCMAVCR
jgi:hypothetical protein